MCEPAGIEKPKKWTRNYDGPWPRTPARVFGTSFVRLYQFTLSGFIGNSCRHIPTCSEYAYEAIARHGLIYGSWLAAKRVVRCNPWKSLGGTHGHDPVPDRQPKQRPVGKS